MTAVLGSPVFAALKQPEATVSWTAAQWEMLVRQARTADLLGRIAALLDDRGLLERVPSAPRAHLVAAQRLAAAQVEEVRREVAHIVKALSRTGVDIVLLKGAAYLFAGLPAADGRIFSDIDILVPQKALAEVEAALMLHGWATSHHEPYDQRYYRKWMHELPPMRHATRGTVLDVHHSIAPLSGRLKPDSRKLLAASRVLAGQSRLKVLAPADMVLHSATHLFLNEELRHGLRDLADFDSLLRHFSALPSFWPQLAARATELELERPLYYGLRYAAAMLGTPLPEEAAKCGARPAVGVQALMDALFVRALQPEHASAADWLTPLARWALYVRAHWLRMPPLLLARHLAVKAFRRTGSPVAQQGAR